MKKRSLFLIVILFTLAISSCKYNFIMPEPEVVTTDSISYLKQIQPIFDNKCIECHKSGADKPYLTTGISYGQIFPAHVNKEKPEESHIYVFPSPANTSEHKWKKYSDNEAKLVLKWITEGAKNN